MSSACVLRLLCLGENVQPVLRSLALHKKTTLIAYTQPGGLVICSSMPYPSTEMYGYTYPLLDVPQPKAKPRKRL
ncbi:hypothetical protein ARMGADRAFT_1017538 [Armillaria gallica]|uniref:Uncharacterized protein n=1 Tax=Armillaria gallica TaxID=47427 RepID=A0A2H3D4J3_ARMGA|nr:hypothetical protein ARMGADRAFT_1017538 [Armillaria gallica]